MLDFRRVDRNTFNARSHSNTISLHTYCRACFSFAGQKFIRVQNCKSDVSIEVSGHPRISGQAEIFDSDGRDRLRWCRRKETTEA
jgi:hypothetical protein